MTLQSLSGLRPLVLGILLVAGVPAAARAQIYTWRDSNGTLVMSATKPASGTETRTFSVPGAESVRSTRRVEASYKADYDAVINDAAKSANVRPDLVRAVIQVESGFDPRARSSKGAMRLMQLMPGTAAALGVSNPYNPEQNIRGGVTYLRQLLDKYGNNEELALAAYNAGPDAVDRYGYQIPPYRETRDYVNKVKDQTDVTSKTTPPPRTIYRLFEIVEGRKVVKGYQDYPPTSGLYEEVRKVR
jgi:soluble lytic murein transglycosylase-like protein